MPVRYPALRQVLSLVVLCLLTLFAGCSGGSHSPLTPEGARESVGQALMAASTAQYLADVTLDGESIAHRTYFYEGTAPGATRTFAVVPADGAALTIRWATNLGAFESGATAEGAEVRWTAPATEITEAHVTLTVETPEGTLTRLYRLNVQTAPPETRYAIPQAISEIDLHDPHAVYPQMDHYTVAENELLVAVAPGGDEADILTAFNALHLGLIYKHIHAPLYHLYYNGTAEFWTLIDQLRALPFVVTADPNLMYFLDNTTPNDPQYGQQYCLPLQKLPEAWDVGKGDANQIIAIMDTGTGRQHPDLMAKVVDGEDFIVPIGDGLGGDTLGDGIDNNGQGGADEGTGHGVHCSGISAAISDNAVGGAGMAWNTKLMGLRIFPTNGDDGASSSSINAAHGYLADHNNNVANTAKIVSCNMSFGSYGSSGTDQNAINEGTDSGCTYAGAAGNDNIQNLHYPSNYDNVIAVASIASGDVKSSFSNYGTWIDVSAAGSAIYNTYFHGPPGTPNPNIYGTLSGTSMACPQVAGLIALIKGNAPTLTPDEVTQQILATADNIDGANPSYVGRLGSGRINAFKALTQDLSPVIEYSGGLWLADSEVGFTTGNRDGRINAGEKIGVLPLLTNSGLRSLTDGGIEITNPADPHLTVLNPTITVSSVSRAEGIDTDSYFAVVVSPTAPDNYEKSYDITVTDPNGEGPWNFSFTVHVDADTPAGDTINGVATDMTGGVVFRPSIDLPFFSVDLPGDANYLTIHKLTVSLIGTIDPTHVQNIRLWQDNGNGTFQGELGDLELGLVSYLNNSIHNNFDRQNDPAAGVGRPQDRNVYGGADISSGSVTFTDIRLPIADGDAVRLFVSADVLSNAGSGVTAGLQVTSASDAVISAGDTLGGFPWGSGAAPVKATWSTDAQFSFGNDLSWRAKADLDSAGHVYVVYDDDRAGDFDIFLKSSADGGRTWSAERAIVTDGNQDFFPDVAAGPAQEVYMTWYTTRHGNGNREIYFKRSTDFGATWGSDIRVTNSNGDGRVPRLTYGNGAVHVVWFDEKSTNDDYNVFYTHSLDAGGSWEPEETVSNTPTDRLAEDPQIEISGDTLYCAWFERSGSLTQQGANHRVYYNHRAVAGSWGTPRAITPTTEVAYGVRLAPVGDGRAYAAYHSDAGGDFDVWLQLLNDDVTDETEQVTFDVGDTGFPSVVYDPPTGRIDIAFDNTVDGGTTNVYHIARPTPVDSWTAATQLSHNAGGLSQQPFLLREQSLGDMFCFWNDDRGTGETVTWFSTLIN